MEATARNDSTTPVTASPPRPPLELVPSDDHPSATEANALVAAEEGRVWRAAMCGGAIGFAVVAVVLAIAAAASGMDLASAVGLGVFVGIFSGGGFGFMGGAVFTLAGQTDRPGERRQR